MDPVHDTRRRFDVRFHLLAIAFLVFDVELLFLYPWAVTLVAERGPAPVASATSLQDPAGRPFQPTPVPADSRAADKPAQDTQFTVRPIFVGGIVFLAILTLGLVYDWRKGVFLWR
jgi:NADH-quinone oxidoreductase subunit A